MSREFWPELPVCACCLGRGWGMRDEDCRLNQNTYTSTSRSQGHRQTNSCCGPGTSGAENPATYPAPRTKREGCGRRHTRPVPPPYKRSGPRGKGGRLHGAAVRAAGACGEVQVEGGDGDACRCCPRGKQPWTWRCCRRQRLGRQQGHWKDASGVFLALGLGQGGKLRSVRPAPKPVQGAMKSNRA